MADYKLISYYTAEGANADQYHWEATPRQLAAMDIYKDGVIDTRCAQAVWDFIHGNWSGVSLGLHEYTYMAPSDYESMDNVSNLLIIDGWYDKEVGIPFLEFVSNPWIVHEKFFNYLLNMSVTKYSNSENITYVQKLLTNYQPTGSGATFTVGIYSDDMRNMVKDYQRSKIEYTYGDLDLDGKLTNKDLTIMREYLYGLDDTDVNTPITLAELRGHLDGTLTLDYKKLEWADVNQDGVIDEFDYELLKIFKGDKTLAIKVRDYLDEKDTLTLTEEKLADMNKDGFVTEDDYTTLNSYPRQLQSIQMTYAQVKHDGVIDTECYDIIKANIEGTSDSLRIYKVPFALGWYDVQTDYLLESDYNMDELLSEVSK